MKLSKEAMEILDAEDKYGSLTADKRVTKSLQSKKREITKKILSIQSRLKRAKKNGN